jgi:hypothetical protein
MVKQTDYFRPEEGNVRMSVYVIKEKKLEVKYILDSYKCVLGL